MKKEGREKKGRKKGKEKWLLLFDFCKQWKFGISVSSTPQCGSGFNWRIRITIVWKNVVSTLLPEIIPKEKMLGLWTAYQKLVFTTQKIYNTRIFKFSFWSSEKCFQKRDKHRPPPLFFFFPNVHKPNPLTHTRATASWLLFGHSGMEIHHWGIILHRAERTWYLWNWALAG